MPPLTLTQTFLILCCAVSVAAVVVGRIASPSLEHTGWLGMTAFALLFAGMTMVGRRQRER